MGSPLDPILNLSTPAGLNLQAEILSGLSRLDCPDDERCSVLIDDGGDSPGIHVSLVRQRSVLADQCWSVDFHESTGTYLYTSVFQTESAAEIVAAIKRILEMPAVP